MSKRGWRLLFAVVLIALALWFWWRGRRAPDERLAGHFDDICQIAEDGASAPSRGVDHLFAYLSTNAPDMLADFGATLVAIERIPDDARHDDRARDAARRLQEPLLGCADDLQRFGEAIERDPDARAKFERGTERLSRTLSILLGVDRAQARRWIDQFTGMSVRSRPPGYQ